jgi:tetratricopeptide (TPR) repeat protein
VADNPRILELRRRVEADPSSIAFAQLAEEYRRAGNFEEAEKVCRQGLGRHPAYLSARVTLGRTLIERGDLDAAMQELQFVLDSAPDNLAAIRGIAEIHQCRGDLRDALEYYRRAMPLARHDPELEETVNQIKRELGDGKAIQPTTLSFEQAHEELLNAALRMAAETKPQPETVSGSAAQFVSEAESPRRTPSPDESDAAEQFLAAIAAFSDVVESSATEKQVAANVDTASPTEVATESSASPGLAMEFLTEFERPEPATLEASQERYFESEPEVAPPDSATQFDPGQVETTAPFELAGTSEPTQLAATGELQQFEPTTQAEPPTQIENGTYVDGGIELQALRRGETAPSTLEPAQAEGAASHIDTIDQTEAPIDFDDLLQSLGRTDRSAPPLVEALLAGATAAEGAVRCEGAPDAPVHRTQALDAPKHRTEPSAPIAPSAPTPPAAEQAVLAELEAWLAELRR